MILENGSEFSFAQGISRAIHDAMADDGEVISFGLGVTDPKGVFGTTLGLEERFGSEKVFDIPTSENALTGVGIGAALAGTKVLMTHQRLDFALLSMDQIVNGAAKWRYMFNDQYDVPLTIRMIIGRGWGQGATHSQNLQAWFAHIPGLKVVMPSDPVQAQDLLYTSILDPNPVIFLEHRWLHEVTASSMRKSRLVPIGPASIVKDGGDVTVIASSIGTRESMRAISVLRSSLGVSSELIDVSSIKPMDWDTIFASVRKTGRLVVVDSGFEFCSVGSEIISRVCTDCFSSLQAPPVKLAMPDVPEPTSFALTKGLYVRAGHICDAVCDVLGLAGEYDLQHVSEPQPHDVPGAWFNGPF